MILSSNSYRLFVMVLLLLLLFNLNGAESNDTMNWMEQIHDEEYLYQSMNKILLEIENDHQTINVSYNKCYYINHSILIQISSNNYNTKQMRNKE